METGRERARAAHDGPEANDEATESARARRDEEETECATWSSTNARRLRRRRCALRGRRRRRRRRRRRHRRCRRPHRGYPGPIRWQCWHGETWGSKAQGVRQQSYNCEKSGEIETYALKP